MADRLKKDIMEALEKKTGFKEASISVQLSILKRKYTGLTLNAAAQIYAQKHGTSIMPKLTESDKNSLSQVQLTMVPKRQVTIAPNRKTTNKVSFLLYETQDRFEKKHIQEINGTYSAHCYTATYILCRKVMENLIIKVLKKKFPSHTDKNLYEDTKKHRFLDFSEVLDNLYRKRSDFSTTAHNAIDRLKQKCTPFRKDANSKTHSLFHIATKTEIDNADVPMIFDLIVVVMKEVGLQ